MFAQRCRRIFFYSLFCGFAVWPVFAVSGAEGEMFVEEFLLLEDQWPLWAEQEKVLSVEGRFKTMTRRSMTLQQSELSFKPINGLEFDRSQSDSDIVRARGVFRRDEDKELFFEVNRLEHLPSLEAEEKLQNLKVDVAAPEAFYHQARRYYEYGRFYEEDEFLKRADELYASGLETERNRTEGEDYRALFALADRASQLSSYSRYEMELRHEAFRRWWATLRHMSQDGSKFDEFLDQLLAQLTSAEAPLTEKVEELEQKYITSPLEFYHESDNFTRQILHRLFYIQAVEEHLQRQLTVDGSTGMELADRLESLAPEKTKTIKELRQAGLKFRLDRIELLTRSEMLQVRQYYLDYGEEEKAKAAASEWLDNREKRVAEEGPAGVPQLARDRIELLGEKKKGVEFLLDTIRTHPEAGPVKEELNKQGYAFIDGSWRDLKSWEESQEEDPQLKAMRQGFVVEGMTFDQVERTLGYPVSSLRSVSSLSISEVWVYPQSETTRLLVYFQWARGKSRSNARVDKVVQQ
ncbi:MAG: hypothetical protein KDA65_14325 [Planctomycetaceae bacterium]|nr:hypothetical protein [Planctomycetaceae bacterium]